ncbi:sigma-54 dependent transcriptional regulator [bacterium]|nr:sigma-54 dependent transcriptional regulator [bacterium]
MKILVVDDDKYSRTELTEYLRDELGHDITPCDSGTKALQFFENNPFPLVLSDIRMPEMDGIELLKRLKAMPAGRQTYVVLITGYGDVNSAVSAFHAGSYDYLMKPVNPEELKSIIGKIAEHQSLLEENYELKHRFESKVAEVTQEAMLELEQVQKALAEVLGVGRIGVFSSKMRDVVRLAKRLHEDRSVPVLIEGETGTGKEFIAKLVNYGPHTVTTPFVSINCSAIAPNLFESELFGYEGGAFSGAKRAGQKGKFELAQGGTLFLDEIGDMPLEMQPKLLRVLQEKEYFRVGGIRKLTVDVRIICSTNKNLEKLSQAGAFRSDLYYRLNTGRIHLPALRERKEEIRPLAQMFLEYFAEQKKSNFKSFSEEAIGILEEYPWPGNVRELQNLIERVVLLYDDVEIKPCHLRVLKKNEGLGLDRLAEENDEDYLVVRFLPGGLNLETIEKEIIKKALFMFDGNKSRVARYLGINRATLYNKLDDKAV